MSCADAGTQTLETQTQATQTPGTPLRATDPNPRARRASVSMLMAKTDAVRLLEEKHARRALERERREHKRRLEEIHFLCTLHERHVALQSFVRSEAKEEEAALLQAQKVSAEAQQLQPLAQHASPGTAKTAAAQSIGMRTESSRTLRSDPGGSVSGRPRTVIRKPGIKESDEFAWCRYNFALQSDMNRLLGAKRAGAGSRPGSTLGRLRGLSSVPSPSGAAVLADAVPLAHQRSLPSTALLLQNTASWKSEVQQRIRTYKQEVKRIPSSKARLVPTRAEALLTNS